MPEHATPPPFDGVITVGDGAEHVVGGLRLVERAAFTLARAGAHRLVCVGTRPTAPLRLPDLPIAWIAAADATSSADLTTSSRVIVTDATTIADPATIAALARAPEPSTLSAPAPAVLWRADAATIRASPLVAPAAAHPWQPPSGALLCAATDAARRAEAERGLYARLGRSGDGWFTRHVDRRLSRALTRVLLPTGISPNQVTLVSIAIGIVGGCCFAEGSTAVATIGALLFLASTIIDGCDGEIARLTFRESAFGARLDILGDNVVHLFLFGGIATGLYRRSADPGIAALGVALVVGVLVAMTTVYLQVVRRPPSPAQQTLFEAFASREFAYLLVGLTLAGRLDWFLWLSAFGTYVFSFGLILLGRRRPAS